MLIGAVALLALLRWLDLHPIPLPSADPRAAAEPVRRLGHGPVALLVDGAASPPSSFDGDTWDWAWLNTL